MTLRIAAVGDVHAAEDTRAALIEGFAHLDDQADVFLLAGDLTTHGRPRELAVLLDALEGSRVPKAAVLGNHDFQSDLADDLRTDLRRAGIHVLDGNATTFEVNGTTVGIAGTPGFGGGFEGASASDFGEPEMKAFIRHTKRMASQLRDALGSLDTDVRIALLHYSPVPDTLSGERLEIYPFLGSYLLAEVIDECGADLALHGHAHAGKERGATPGGVPVRNVAQAVIRHSFRVYELDV
ncbi:MAG TPA: metallophosphoesterase [Actinomycetota bacterium]|nr:metallophosphoesterase [Actinomycetota bacterium]